MSQITLGDIDDRLNRLEDRIVKRIDDHEDRIRANEGFRYRMLGVAAIISAAVATFSGFILDIIRKQ